MHPIAPATSDRRLQRYYRWAMLWLAWFAAFLNVAAEFAPLSKEVHIIGHRWLDYIEALIIRIVVARAGLRARRATPRKRIFEHRPKHAALFRALAGSRMRNALRSRDLQQRIVALRQNVDVLVAQLLRRLPRGLTRRRPTLARPEILSATTRRADVLYAIAPCADTS